MKLCFRCCTPISKICHFCFLSLLLFSSLYFYSLLRLFNFVLIFNLIFLLSFISFFFSLCVYIHCFSVFSVSYSIVLCFSFVSTLRAEMLSDVGSCELTRRSRAIQKLRAAGHGWIWFCSPTKLANAPAAPITLSDYRSTNAEFLLSQGCTKQQSTAAEGVCGNVDLTRNYYFCRIKVGGTKYRGRMLMNKTHLTRCNTHEVYKGGIYFRTARHHAMC